MNIFKKILKYWLTLSSVAGFLLGWVFVSHSSEAKFSNTTAANTGGITALPPVLSLNSLISGNTQQITTIQPFTVVQSSPFQPRLRTGGS